MDTSILLTILGVIVGAVGSYFFVNMALKSKKNETNRLADLTLKEAKLNAQRKAEEAEVKAEKIMARAESHQDKIKQKKIKEYQKKTSEIRSNFEDFKSKELEKVNSRKLEIQNLENSLKQKTSEYQSKKAKLQNLEDDIEEREKEIATIKENLNKQLEIVSKKKAKLDQASEEHIKALETVANLSQEKAKEQLLQEVKSKTETEAMALIKTTISEAKLSANKEAKKIVIQTIQRKCAEFTIENTVSIFNLESDEIKGQIIGREGRNIRALEAATGAEIVVDDTPEVVIISSFDPVRREICRLSLKRLVADGRIHPARIEEVVEKVKKELTDHIVEIGERTVIDLNIHGLNAYLIKMVGRMRFRSSYGQNLLKHSIEVAHLCASMAAELGLSQKQVKLAKRAGLLHDIGKVSEEDSELSHALIGFQLCEKYKENPVVCNAVGAHHDEMEMKNIISPIIQACDAISGARPGARREILESYLKRIKELEDVALEYEGVSKAFALQAGRELRVILESEKVSDEYADDLAFMISQKIQDEMQYPGQIKVTVIREKRAISIAR